MNLYALLFVDDYPAEKGDPGFEGWVGAGDWQTKNIRAFPRRATSVMSYIVFIFFFYCYAFHQFLYWHKYLNSSQNFKLPWVNNKVELGASLEWQISMKSSMRLLAVFLQPQHWGSEVNSKDGNACQMPGKKEVLYNRAEWKTVSQNWICNLSRVQKILLCWEVSCCSVSLT